MSELTDNLREWRRAGCLSATIK